MRDSIRLLFLVPVSAGFCTAGLSAQARYRDPPPAIARILDAPLPPSVRVSPDRRWLLVLERPGFPSIKDVAAPDLKLAGVRIDPATNAQSRSFGLVGLRLRAVDGGVERPIVSPPGAKLDGVAWAPDSRRVAFAASDGRGITLWIADVATGEARPIQGARLNAVFGNPCEWLTAGSLVCTLVPEGRPPFAAPASVPEGPVIQESEGRVAPNRTYQDLLENADDEKRFDYYFSSQVAVIGVDGAIERVGEIGIHRSVGGSPDGRFLAVETIHRPYSYLVPFTRFPHRVEIWNRSGVVVRRLADVPLEEEVPPSFDAVTTGPREVGWRSDQPATLVWVEARDGGDPATAARYRDRVLSLAEPFAGEPRTLLDLEYRFDSIDWGRTDLAVVHERWYRTRRERSWIIDPAAGPGAARLLHDRSFEDRYADPGALLAGPGPFGRSVIQLAPGGKAAFLAGRGASPEGDRPFLDRLDLATGRATRLWRSEAPFYEEVVDLIDPAGDRVLTRRESVDQPPNYFVRDLASRRLTQLTRFADPAPEFARVTKRLVTYTRADGVQLSATLYLPPGYDPSRGRLPFFLWAYPFEFKSAAAASQVVGSPYRFTRPVGPSHLFLALHGYGVLDGPTMPIVGEGAKEPNDSYVEQLVASARAAVDKIVSMGVADRNRIGIGGHSYGAFMTANLLAHSDLFRAGVARSGAYNRSLTPFGFQAEQRTYWQAPEVYRRMSPFTYADSIKAPILLIHGIADDNSGTFPVQSERLYAAIKGNGGKARLVMLPAEAHGYRARESIGHTLYETIAWLDKYVKGEGKDLTP